MSKTMTINGHKVTLSGPFKGSKQNGGREIYTYKNPTTGKTSSINAARADYEIKHGKLDRDTDVDHKDGNKSHDSDSNHQAMSHKKNVAKGNKERHHHHHRKAKK